MQGRLRPAPGRHPPGPRPAPADLPADRGLRPLRPRGRRLHLGAPGPRRRGQVGPRPVEPHHVRSTTKRGHRPTRVDGPASCPTCPRVGRAFDYLVADGMEGRVGVGTHGAHRAAGPPRRRVGDGARLDAAARGTDLRPLAKVTGLGAAPRPGRPRRLGGVAVGGPGGVVPRTASPPRAVTVDPRRATRPGTPSPTTGDDLAEEAFDRDRDGPAAGPGRRPLPAGARRLPTGQRSGPPAVAGRGPAPRAAPAPGRRPRGRACPTSGPRPGAGARSWAPGARPGRRWSTWPPCWSSTSTTRPTSRSRPRRGTPATSSSSGPGGPVCPASWPRRARRSRRWTGGRCAPRPGRSSARAGRSSTWSTAATTTPGRTGLYSERLVELLRGGGHGGVRAQPQGPGPAPGLRGVRRDGPLRALRQRPGPARAGDADLPALRPHPAHGLRRAAAGPG